MILLSWVTRAGSVSVVQHNAKLPTEMLDEAFRRIEEELQAIGRVRRGYEAGQKSMQPDIQHLRYGTASHDMDGSPAQPCTRVDVHQETSAGASLQDACPSLHHHAMASVCSLAGVGSLGINFGSLLAGDESEVMEQQNAKV